MSSPLLTTKLYVPPVSPRLVPRPQLIQQLDEGLRLGHRLTLVSAPAGFGKTTLLSDWLRQTDRRVAWLSLDDGDNDLVRFLAYLFAALQGIDPVIGQTAQAMLQAPQASPPEPLLTTLINDIVATSEPFILVLDDYHVIEVPSVHGAVSFLVDHMPPTEQGMHLVVATRADPPLPIARLRGRGQLTELYSADLRFTPNEAGVFFNKAVGLALSAEHVAALERRTEGWVAGLQLAALSMRGRDDVSGFIKAFTGSHRYVLDYLTEEVLNRQCEDTRAFLLQTAILDRLTGPLCDAVRFGLAETPSSSRGTAVKKRTDSRSLLAALEAANLFTIPLDDDRRWYRYHRLFADLLRQRLQREEPQLVPDLHRRASAWYEQNGLLPDAVGHLLAARDFERAAYLVEQATWPMLARGESAMLLGWLDALPNELVRSQPQFGIFHAWALALGGRLDDVEPCLADADVEHVQGEVAAVRAYVAGVRGDVPRAIELANRASETLPEENLLLRVIVALNLGIAYWSSGDPAAASWALTEVIILSQEADQPYLTLRATTSLGHVQAEWGLLRQAIQTHREALELASKPGHRPVPYAGLAYAGMAELLYEWNDLASALHYATECIRLSELGGRVSIVLAGRMVLALVYQAQGDVDGALETIQGVERLAQRHGHAYVMAEIAELRARLWLAQGNLAAASRWAQKHRLSSDHELKVTAREIEQIAVARVLVAQGKCGEALKLLARLQIAAQAAERMKSVIKIGALQALAFRVQGDMNQALSTLERALSLAEPEGYVRTFVDEGEPMAKLLRRALSQGIAPDYTARLLDALGERAAPVPPAVQPLIEPLTQRELEVLGLIAAGLSNAEIARELVIAVSTVKSHINHIYGKLAVESRTRAVARARELGLL